MKKVKEIDLAELKQCSRELARKVRHSGFEADHVLCVERAGLFIGADIADLLGCTCSGIYASRSGSSIKSRLKIILRFMPRTITHFLRGIELKSNIHGTQKARNVYIETNFPPKDKNILLVDDAIDTGNSILSIMDFLETHGYDRGNIKVGALTVTQQDVKKLAVFYLFDCTCAFPWSYDSREYDKAWQLYAALKADIDAPQ